MEVFTLLSFWTTVIVILLKKLKRQKWKKDSSTIHNNISVEIHVKFFTEHFAYTTFNTQNRPKWMITLSYRA